MIRNAQASDFDDLYDIFMHETINPFLSFEIMAKETFKPIYQQLSDAGEHFVLIEDGIIASNLIVIRHPRRVAHVATLSTLATAPAFQGKGLTKKFMQEILVKLKQGGVKRVDLMAEADNEKALKFYASLGFEVEGTLKQCFKRANQSHYIDEILMAKLI